jgi:hypothetical protein
MIRVFAQSLELPGGTKIKGPSGFAFNSLGDVIGGALKVIFPIAGIGLLLMIISAGFTLMTSAGDPKKMQAGTQRLTYAIVGFLIIFAAYWLVQIAGRVFGIPEIQSIFGS